MNWEFKDRYGRRIGTARQRSEDEAAGEGMAYLLIAAIVVAPFAPLLLAAYVIFDRLIRSGLHELFSGAMSIGFLVFSARLLWKSSIVRLWYFGLVTVLASVIVFLQLRGNVLSIPLFDNCCSYRLVSGERPVDIIWSSFWALLVLFVGGLLTRWLYQMGDK